MLRAFFAALLLAGCAQGEAVSDGSGGSGGFIGTGGSSGFGTVDGPDRPGRDATPFDVDAAMSTPDAAMSTPDAAMSTVDAAMAGVCGTAPVIVIPSLPYDVTMTTTGGMDNFHVTGSGNDLATNCLDGDGLGSPDVVFQLTLAAATNVNITTGNPGTNFPVVLYVRSSDCRTYDGCDNQLATNQPPATLQGSGIPAGTYFIIVDGQNASGTFHLTVTTF